MQVTRVVVRRLLVPVMLEPEDLLVDTNSEGSRQAEEGGFSGLVALEVN